MDEAVAALRAFNRFYTRFAGALDAHYMDSDLSLAEARLLYEIANREAPLAAELQAELGLDAGYVSRILRRFQAKGWIERGRGEDARRRPISLTEAGRRLFRRRSTRAPAPRSAGRIEALGAADRETLVGALAAVTGPARRRRARPGISAPSAPATSFTIAARQSILYEPYGWGRPMEILQGEITTAFLRDFKPGREQCWVAERAGMMAGAVLIVDAGDNVGQLRLLHVEPWARGLGIGKRAGRRMRRLRARRPATSVVRLWTHTVLTRARRIYEAAGFRIVSTEVHHEFGKPEQGETWELALKA